MKKSLSAMVLVLVLCGFTFTRSGGVTTTGGGSGNSPASVAFSGSPGQVFFTGAMDNNVTSTLTDSTNCPFTSANVGNLVNVDQVGSGSTDAVGTISTFISTCSVGLSFNNISGGAKGALMYAFGPDNSTALNTFSTALAAGAGHSGVQGIIPAGYYAIGATGHLTYPTDRTTVVLGAGGGLISEPPGSPNGNTNASSMPATMLMTLTHSGSGALVQAANGLNHGTYNMQSRLQDIALMGSVGFKAHGDGMCGTCDGMDIINWTGISTANVSVWGFGRRGVYMDCATTGSPVSNNVGGVELNHTLVMYNGEQGVKIGGNCPVIGTNNLAQIQNVYIDGFSFIFGNNANGVQVFSSVRGLSIKDSGFQGNLVFCSYPACQGEVSIEGQVTGGVISGNYFEMDNTGTVGLAIRTATSPPATMGHQLAVVGNYMLALSGSYAHMLIGGDATHTVGGVNVQSNWFDGFATGSGICLDVLGGDLTNTGEWNQCQHSASPVRLPGLFALPAGANYGCDALTEGASAFQSNSTAACAANTIATTAGTTHCQIVCKQAAGVYNWYQSGL